MNASRLISHHCGEGDLQAAMENLSTSIRQQGDTEFSVAQRLQFLQELSEFEFGRFLIINRGINGYWTHYMLTYPWFGKKTGKNDQKEPIGNMEHFLLNSPLLKATQQRFQIFLEQNQACVKDGATLASIPCGLLGELLYLDYDAIRDISLTGLDYDNDTLHDAKVLADKKNLSAYIELIQTDAWSMNINNQFDLLSSNGLNIYEPSDDKVTKLYQEFYAALKPGGKLVTSFVTPPPTMTNQCEWRLDKLNLDELLKQKAIFADTLQVKWQCYRSTDKTRKQLESVGFTDLTFIADDAHLFPTVVAIKP